MSLQDRLNQFKSDFEGGKLPFKPEKHQLDIIARSTQALVASGKAERALKAGDQAPAFVLEDAEGRLVNSRELLARGPVVLSFYRGVWCPYCNIELSALEGVQAEISARGATLIAISPQTKTNSRKAQRDNKLSFPILSDPGLLVADAFGIKFKLEDDLIELYKGFGNDLPTVNGDSSWTLPMPARYVINRQGVIVYAEVNPDYTHRPDPSELLPVLDELRAREAV